MPAQEDNKPMSCLVADIGGTNARFAIAHFEENEIKLQAFQSYTCAEYHDLDTILETYLSALTTAVPANACLAIAGPISQKKVHITNLGWEVETEAFKNKFKFKQLLLINDFAALAQSTTTLPQGAVTTLHIGEKVKDGPVSVMGPGTGFGVAMLVKQEDLHQIIASEGGHISFVPNGEKELKVWAALMASMGRVTVETFLSGVGIMRIYRELCHIHDITPLNYEPSTISNRALDHADPICLETLEVFCGMLGSVAGDLALAQGASGGVYLAGGILPKMPKFLRESNFMEAFLDKAPMQDFIKKIPVHLITAPDAALYGAALSFQNHTKHKHKLN